MCIQKKLLGLMLPLMVGFNKLNSNSLIFDLYDYFSVILKASNKIFVKEESAESEIEIKGEKIKPC